jgi:hypothetical protein
VSPVNIDSYEPNLAICEYLANRCQPAALNCLKKLNDILNRKLKRDPNRGDPQTECIIKLNIIVLLILQGRRDSALLLLSELYKQKQSLI